MRSIDGSRVGSAWPRVYGGGPQRPAKRHAIHQATNAVHSQIINGPAGTNAQQRACQPLCMPRRVQPALVTRACLEGRCLGAGAVQSRARALHTARVPWSWRPPMRTTTASWEQPWPWSSLGCTWNWLQSRAAGSPSANRWGPCRLPASPASGACCTCTAYVQGGRCAPRTCSPVLVWGVCSQPTASLHAPHGCCVCPAPRPAAQAAMSEGFAA